MNNPYQTGWNPWNGFLQDNGQNRQNSPGNRNEGPQDGQSQQNGQQNAQQSSQQNAQQSSQQNAQQSSQQNAQDWIQNPNLRGMDQEKLRMLNSIASQGSQKGRGDLLPFLMSAASQNQSNGLKFTPREMDNIVEVLKMGKAPQEAARIDRMMQIVKMMR